MITQEQLQQIVKFKSIDKCVEWLEPINVVFEKYSIDSVNRMASFLAQTCHESLNYTVLQENLNYSAEGLRITFGKYFPTLAIAQQYARKPIAIANKVYANRMGNGDEASGDGSRYMGRGLIQLTGKTNYTNFATAIGKNVPELLTYLLSSEGAVESAGWFWNKLKLNTYADIGDLRGQTKVINGGFNGIDDRIQRFNAAISILSN